MDQGIISINPLMPYEDIKTDKISIPALGLGLGVLGSIASENKNLMSTDPDIFKKALMRSLAGPTAEIFNRTTDTPSGKVFAPTGEVIESNQIPGMAPAEQQQKITGLPIPEKVPGLPGLINPEQVDTSILNKEETEDSPILTENLTEKESKYLTELLTDTGGGKFEAEILQEVPSLMIKDNKLIIKQKDLNSFEKFLDELYIGEKAPSGKGANTIPPRLRGFGDSDASIVGKLFKNTTELNIKKQPIETETDPQSKYTLSRELDPKLLDEMLIMRGGVKGFQESMQRDNAPLPPSTKRQMFIRYNEKIMDKYGFDKSDKDIDTMPPEELKKLRQKYFVKQDAVDYIVSAAYDVIGGKKERPNEDTIFALDDEGLPVAAVKMGMGNLFGKGRMEGIAIEEAGSLFPEAMDMVIEEAKKVAKKNDKKFLVAEDLTSDAAYNSFIKRGFKPAKSKKFNNMFEGRLVYRPGGGRKVKQKNLVFELEPIEEKAKGGLIDKPLSGGNRYI